MYAKATPIYKGNTNLLLSSAKTICSVCYYSVGTWIYKLGITILMLGQVDYTHTCYNSTTPIKVNVKDTMTG
jgi:hypothetical protein